MVCLFFLLKDKVFKNKKEEIINELDMYVASSNLSVDLYDLEYNKIDTIIRGTKVKAYEKDLAKAHGPKNIGDIRVQIAALEQNKIVLNNQR